MANYLKYLNVHGTEMVIPDGDNLAESLTTIENYLTNIYYSEDEKAICIYNVYNNTEE